MTTNTGKVIDLDSGSRLILTRLNRPIGDSPPRKTMCLEFHRKKNDDSYQVVSAMMTDHEFKVFVAAVTSDEDPVVDDELLGPKHCFSEDCLRGRLLTDKQTVGTPARRSCECECTPCRQLSALEVK